MAKFAVFVRYRGPHGGTRPERCVASGAGCWSAAQDRPEIEVPTGGENRRRCAEHAGTGHDNLIARDRGRCARVSEGVEAAREDPGVGVQLR